MNHFFYHPVNLLAQILIILIVGAGLGLMAGSLWSALEIHVHAWRRQHDPHIREEWAKCKAEQEARAIRYARQIALDREFDKAADAGDWKKVEEIRAEIEEMEK